ncbi:MAG: hypothetical protein LIO74_07835 [Ruminococcus sp.]|nr:hypothetical protein [Ruminococcus sp.]
MPLLEAQRFAHVQLKKTPQFSLVVLGVAVVFGLWKLFEIVVAVCFLRWYQLPPSALLTDSAILWHIIRWVLAVPKAVMKISCSWHIWQLSANAAGILSSGEIYPKEKNCVVTTKCHIAYCDAAACAAYVIRCSVSCRKR